MGIKLLFALLGRAWCRRFHGEPFMPSRGLYRCRVCLRLWEVPWAGEPVAYQPRPETGIDRVQREAAEELAKEIRELERMMQ